MGLQHRYLHPKTGDNRNAHPFRSPSHTSFATNPRVRATTSAGDDERPTCCGAAITATETTTTIAVHWLRHHLQDARSGESEAADSPTFFRPLLAVDLPRPSPRLPRILPRRGRRQATKTAARFPNPRSLYHPHRYRHRYRLAPTKMTASVERPVLARRPGRR